MKRISMVITGVALALGSLSDDVAGQDRPFRDVQNFGEAMQSLAVKYDLRAPYVIDGIPVPEGAYPWQVALVQAGTADNKEAQFCGGTLLGARWVLTAAHCVFLDRSSDIQILHGTVDLTTGGQRHNVRSIYVHPQYSHSAIDYDVALLHLAADVPAPYATLASAALPAGSSAKVIGWGVSDAETGTAPEQLLEGPQVTLNLAECRERMRDIAPEIGVSTRMLCAESPEPQPAGGPCYGDSGGSLLVAGPGGEYSVQAGVVSWGPGCSNEIRVGVYADVDALSGWIEAIMEDPSNVERLAELLTGMSMRHVNFRRGLDEARPFEAQALEAMRPVLEQYYTSEAIGAAKISTQMLKADEAVGSLYDYSVLFRVEFAPGQRIAEIAVADEMGYYSYGGWIPADGELFIADDSEVYNWHPAIALINGRPSLFVRGGGQYQWLPYSDKAPRLFSVRE